MLKLVVQKVQRNDWQCGDWIENDSGIGIDRFLLEIHMLKLKTKISLFGIVVLWLMCSQASSKKNWGWGQRGSGSHKDSFADISLDDPLTLLASYVAAPVVLAVAALHQLLRIWVVATAAAHQITAVAANWGFVALPRVSKERKHWIKFSFQKCELAQNSKTFP